MDSTLFLTSLKEALTSIFKEIEAKEEIYAFGIGTDSDINSVLVCYNTYTHFASLLHTYFIEHRIIAQVYRWITPEWYGEISGRENVLLRSIDTALDLLHKNKLNKKQLFNLLTQALLELKSEGLFNNMEDNFILIVDESDSFIVPETLQMIKKLNSEKIYQEYLYDMREEIDPAYLTEA